MLVHKIVDHKLVYFIFFGTHGSRNVVHTWEQIKDLSPLFHTQRLRLKSEAGTGFIVITLRGFGAFTAISGIISEIVDPRVVFSAHR